MRHYTRKNENSWKFSATTQSVSEDGGQQEVALSRLSGDEHRGGCFRMPPLTSLMTLFPLRLISKKTGTWLVLLVY